MTREEAIRTLSFGAWWDNLNPEMSDADSEPLFEALGMAISALRAQQEQESKPLNGWISVKDRLPEEKVNCIVHYKHAYCDNDDYWEIGICFYDGEKFKMDLSYKVTHWQPMPNPPKGE